jgi:hypothetical protein
VSERAPKSFLFVGALIGLAAACAAYDISFFTGAGPRWQYPANDIAAYLTAHAYFVHDRWRLPLFALPMLGYPDGSSVIFCDAIPIVALIAKLWTSLTGRIVNLLGLWVLAAYMLQGVMAVRLVYALGERSRWLAVCIASWSVLSIAFVIRFGHLALQGQFLVLWALALHFEQTRDRQPRILETTLLLTIAVLVNAYLAAMAIAIGIASWLTLGWQRAWSWRAACHATIGVSAVAVVMVISGYFSVPAGTDALVMPQFGAWSWNLSSLVISPHEWVRTLGVERHTSGGQYEGESYLGLGPLLVLIVCLLTRPRAVRDGLTRHWPLVLIVIACAAFAASNRVYFGSTLLVDLPMPPMLLRVAGLFRSHGRFVWPLMYLLTLAPAVSLLRTRRAWSIALILIATGAQVIEARPTLLWSRASSTWLDPPRFDMAQMRRWLSGHDRLWQYPSWYCGADHPRQAPSVEVEGRQQQLQVLAAELGAPTNSAYLSRPLKDCHAEADWARHPTFEPGVLYLFVKDVPYFMPATLDEIRIHASQCRDIGWATACALRPLD